MRRTSIVLTSSLALALGGCGGGGYGGLATDASAVNVQTQLPAPDPVTALADVTSSRIGPLDRLDINVFGSQELSREITVDATGKIALPLVGQMQAAGLTSSELSSAIADKLRGRYLRDPQVSVGVVEMRSQRFTVDGAVTQPGVYPMAGPTSLMQAVASARGASDLAALNRVAVFRTINSQRMAALFNLKDIREGRSPDPQIFANDIVVVGESAARRRYRDIIQAIPILGVFTPVI